jgi:DNA repair protein RecO (recombination protein O)
MIVKSDGLILKSMKYGDTSRIITVYTRDFGKISIIAKGARGKKSKFGSALEPLSSSHLVYYYKSERELQLLSQADLLKQFKTVIESEKKLMAAFAMIEYLNAVTLAEDPHPELFDLIHSSLSDLNDRMTNGAMELVDFLVKLAEGLGFALNFFQCSRCGTKLVVQNSVEHYVEFVERDGGFLCHNCANDRAHSRIRIETIRVLQSSHNNSGQETISQTSFNEAIELLSLHLRTHVEGMRKIRTMSLVHPFD